MPAISLRPGQEQEYTVELDLSRPGISKDWSVVAWGENGDVEVQIDGMRKSQSSKFPHVKRNDSRLPSSDRRGGSSSTSTSATTASITTNSSTNTNSSSSS